MKRFLMALLLAAAGSLVIPMSAGAVAPGYKTFVGCEAIGPPVPAEECVIGEEPGAFIESSIETEYEICVEFPNEEKVCNEEEAIEANKLYVNPIETNLVGTHKVWWHVEGEGEIGNWTFQMKNPPPPPSPPPATTPPPAITPPPAVVNTQTAACLKAEAQVRKLRAQLRKARGLKQKARIRAKLRAVKLAEKRAC